MAGPESGRLKRTRNVMERGTQGDRILLQACPVPEDRRRLLELLEGADLEAWFETVDESPYALEDWIEALLLFDSWLEEKGCSARPVAAMTGYIHCCILTLAGIVALPSLKDLVRENLERYGFQAGQPIDL